MSLSEKNMMTTQDPREFLWTEKYRPHRVRDTILPTELKKVFQTFVDKKNVPNLLLTGGPGVGKTTIARAMCEELGCDYIVVNGSLHGNIDTLRNEIQTFASAVSFSGGRKYVILDEADYLNAQSTQPALRNFMEQYSKNCGFVLTCNYKNKIIKELHSRCSVIDFAIDKSQVKKLAGQFMKRVEGILKDEQVKYDPAVLAQVITKHYPDWRRILNELQRYAAQTDNNIDSGILAKFAEVSIKELIDHMRQKNFTAVRKWVGENSDVDQNAVFRQFYDQAADMLEPASIPMLVLILGKYAFQAAFVVDPQINLAACLAELMVEIKFR